MRPDAGCAQPLPEAIEITRPRDAGQPNGSIGLRYQVEPAAALAPIGFCLLPQRYAALGQTGDALVGGAAQRRADGLRRIERFGDQHVDER
jgi:hypothetical protein